MKIKTLLLITLPLMGFQTIASELEKMQSQQGALKQEINSIQQETVSEQVRLEELKRLIQVQREKNQLLDKLLEAEAAKQQQKPEKEPPAQ